MKINKNGFTLIELLGVIIILSLLVTLIFPSIINSIKNSSNESDELNKKIIYSQADIYIKDNLNNYTVSNGTTFCISLNDLVDSNYIKSPIKFGDYEDITNIYSVKVTYNNSYNYELIENDSCPKPICKRATKLHEVECEHTTPGPNCYSNGYTTDNLGTTIKYGSLGTSGILNSGDAFDCDVNGDGNYDKDTERFYYITDLEQSNNYAVLLYYNNTNLGIADSTSSAGSNYYKNSFSEGPLAAIEHLPTPDDWSNVKLFNYIRPIKTQTGKTSTITPTGEVYEHPQAFSYSNYSARLLTVNEVSLALNGGNLKDNLYLIENTLFNSTDGLYGYYLENPHNLYQAIYSVHIGPMSINFVGNSPTQIGVRPAIEVLKYNIEY